MFCRMSSRSWRAGVFLTVFVAPLSFAVGDADSNAETAGEARPARATLTGSITYRGEIPLLSVVNDLGTRLPLLAVDAKNRGWQFVVIYLESANAPAIERREEEASAGKIVTVDQRGMMFVPHVVAVRHNQIVRFTNSDTSNHNVRAAAVEPRNQFNTFTGPDGTYEHRFQANSRRHPVLIGCDIHAWMRAWVFVFDHSHFAVTDARGGYRIDDLAPGDFRLEIQQPDVGLKVTKEIKLTAGDKKELNLEFRQQDLKLD